MELPIVLETEITSHLLYSYPLSIIKSDPKMLPWYYQHFFDVSSYINENYYVILYTDVPHGTWGIFNDVLEKNYIRVADNFPKEKLIPNIIKYIENGFYPVIFNIDRFYLRNHSGFGKYHQYTEILFYGFNMTDKYFLSIDLDQKVGVTKANYYYDDVDRAYKQEISLKY